MYCIYDIILYIIKYNTMILFHSIYSIYINIKIRCTLRTQRSGTWLWGSWAPASGVSLCERAPAGTPGSLEPPKGFGPSGDSPGRGSAAAERSDRDVCGCFLTKRVCRAAPAPRAHAPPLMLLLQRDPKAAAPR